MSILEKLQSAPRAPLIGIVLVYALLFSGMMWPWGIALLALVVFDIQKGEAWMVEIITRAEHPVMFWFTEIAWFIFGLAFLAFDFFPAQ